METWLSRMAPPWVTKILCYLQLDCPLMIRAQPSVCCHTGPKVLHFTVKKKKALCKTENVQISNIVFISSSVFIFFCRLIFTSLVCLCGSTLHFWCNYTSVYCKSHFILTVYFLSILWCALWYLYHLLIIWFGVQSFLVFFIMDVLVRVQSQSIINTCFRAVISFDWTLNLRGFVLASIKSNKNYF